MLIDNTDSPGFTEAEAAYMGLAGAPVGKGQKFEAPVALCSHCQKQVVLNPLRTRDRGYCPKCDKYLCDRCETARVLTGDCNPWLVKIEKLREAAYKKG